MCVFCAVLFLISASCKGKKKKKGGGGPSFPSVFSVRVFTGKKGKGERGAEKLASQKEKEKEPLRTLFLLLLCFYCYHLNIRVPGCFYNRASLLLDRRIDVLY